VLDLVPVPALPPPQGVDRCDVLLAYEGAGRELVARLKYHNARSALRWLAWQMASLVDPNEIDVVTWVPTTADRRRRRGFDQAELLARAAARQLGRPCRGLLARGSGPPQTGRSSLDRRLGPAIVARPHRHLPARVLLVDDVITTGTTVAVAARALRSSGATTVAVVAAARTPLKRPPSHSDNRGE
jgi:predicted amidophosphoribosyltransferase